MPRIRTVFKQAILFLTTQWRLSEEVSLQQEQASILFQTIRLYFLSGISVSTLFMIAFDAWEHPATVIAYACVIVLYSSLFLIGIRWRRTGNNTQLIRRSILLLLGLGCAWGGLVTLFAITETDRQEPAMVGLAMALVSSPMLCVPLPAAIGFFAPVACACLVTVFLTVDVGYAVDISFVAYLVFSLTGILYTNKTTMDRLVGRLNLQREHEIVRVFLREYEEVSTDWLWETDTDNRLRNVAPRLAETLQVLPERLERLDVFHSDRQADGAISDYDAVIEAMHNKIAFRDRAIAVPTRSGTRWLNVTGHPVHDEKGHFQGYRGIGSDVTAARLDQQRIEFLARHDGLTRLLSRRTFVSETDALLSRHPQRSMALVLIDLDDFKQVNDALGHQTGDTLLEAVAERLSAQLRPGELAARIGGDEFALLLGVSDGADASARADRLGQTLQIDVDAGGSSLPTSTSIGLAVTPEHGTRTDQLMRRADLALYEAKNNGKGMACLFEMRMEHAYLGRQHLLAELGSGIEQNQIIAEYQPIIDIGSGQLVSAEALVRWRHPTRGLLQAGEFVPAAESSDLIEPLGERVLRLACQAAMGWDTAIPVSVNLSPRQLWSGRFLSILQDCLATTGLPPNRLILEVTETVFLEASNRIVQQLAMIRATGVRLVLDDFGTGFSSLTYLHRFDVDGIKIDASFVRDLPGSRKVGAIVRTIGRLASDMNIYVTAEGVETEEQLRWLRGNGITFAQGFLLGRPGRDPASAMTLAASVSKTADNRTLAERPRA